MVMDTNPDMNPKGFSSHSDTAPGILKYSDTSRIVLSPSRTFEPEPELVLERVTAPDSVREICRLGSSGYGYCRSYCCRKCRGTWGV